MSLNTKHARGTRLFQLLKRVDSAVVVDERLVIFSHEIVM